MAQKANPYALRLGINQVWNSYYFSKGRKQASLLKQDTEVRDCVQKSSRDIVQTKIERSSSGLFLFISTTNVGFLTEKNNHRLEKMMEGIKGVVNDPKNLIKVHLIEIKRPFTNAQYIANLIASRIKARTPFRVAVRTVISKVTMQKDIKGIKVKISGRLDGSEIAKTEKISVGKIPLSTLASIIDFATSEARATYGKIGIAVWLYRGKQESYSNHESQKDTRVNRYANTKKNQV